MAIVNAAWEAILATAVDLSVVCELYAADAVPSADGFDPGDALGCFAAVDGITFMGRSYSRLVRRFGGIKRTLGGEINKTSVTFDNLDRAVAAFEFQYGFEGLIMVVRMLSRSQSTVAGETQILFVGRCEKPESGSKEAITVPATFIVGSLDVRIPRRKFGPDDNEGRVSTDPEFEGFVHMPQYGTVSFERIEKRGGFLGWWNKKKVRVTAQWSSYSDYDANKSVPEVFGQIQMMGVIMAAADVGVDIKMRVAFCEGPINDIIDARSVDPDLPISVASGADQLPGNIGTANTDDPSWIAPGYYSRTAYIRCKAGNSGIDVTDPAPDVVAVIQGRKLYMPSPDGLSWGNYGYSDNPAAVVRFLLTDQYYYQLDDAWLDNTSFVESFIYCGNKIFNTSVDDFIFVEEG